MQLVLCKAYGRRVTLTKSSQFMEYMKLHHISLCQDMEALSTDKEYTTEELLEIADLQGRINQTWELLSVATDIMNSSNERYINE
jgi:hypothetical protein